MKLEAKRAQWEVGLTPTAVIPSGDTVTVILKDHDGWYHVHHYMKIAGGWDVSADLQRGTAEYVVVTLKKRFPAG